MIMDKSVFCVIVTYNGMKWVDKCLSSLRDTDYPIRTIVIDNGSIDGTVEAIRFGYPEVEVVQAPSNLGFGMGNNEGIKKALDRGADYIFLLNQDAYWWKGSIKKMLQIAEEDDKAGIISPVHYSADKDNLDFGFYRYANHVNGLLEGLATKGEHHVLYETRFVNAAAWIIKAVVIRKMGLFHPIFDHYGEDNEFVDRLFKHGYKMKIYAGCFIIHDRVQVRSGSFFNSGESYKRKILLDYVIGNLSAWSVHKRYFKVFIRQVIGLKFIQAWGTLKNWVWILRKIKQNKYLKPEHY